MVAGIALNRGFGFVQYEDESSAIEAIKQENGAVFRGKKMGMLCKNCNLCEIFSCISNLVLLPGLIFVLCLNVRQFNQIHGLVF